MTVEEILAAMQAIIDSAQSDDGTPRSLTTEEQDRYAQLEAELRTVQASNETRARHSAYLTVPTSPALVTATRSGAGEKSPELRAFSHWLRTNQETRALSKGTDAAGGYLVPDEWRDKLVECIRSFGGFLDNVERITTSDGRTLFWPTVDDGTNAGAIVAEAAAFAGGADPTFGEGSLGAYKYTTTGAGNNPLKVSVELLQDSMIDVDALLRKLFARRISRKQATDAVVGTGTGQPKGILNGTPDYNLTVSNTWDGTNNNYADLLAISFLIDQEYLQNAKWLMNKNTFAQILALVDTAGRPLIEPSTAGIGDGVGRGLTLLGYPVILDSAAPNAADNVNFMAFGDFREAYVWRDVADLSVIQDPYTSKSTGQVEYVAWQRGSGTVQARCAYAIVAGKTS